MIKDVLIKGDTHGDYTFLKNIDKIRYNPKDTAIIILGDCGFNYFLDWRDNKLKKKVNQSEYQIYCIKGNHETRPSAVETIKKVYDNEVQGYVWVEDKYPNIHYFEEVGKYNILNYKCLIIGGAYSVDKYYRLQNFMKPDGWSGWFADEQLSDKEMDYCEEICKGEKFDFIFSHTCPYRYRPTDMFLSFVDQNTVDVRTEIWMNKIANTVKYKNWVWGHYHADRIEAPHHEIMFVNTEDINNIYNRWEEYDKTGQVDWYMPKSPNYYLYEEERKEKQCIAPIAENPSI